MSIKDLTPPERFIWDWLNVKLGGFKMALLSAIREADIQNLEKLRLGFPVEVEGWVDYKQITGWWEVVQLKAGKSLCRFCVKANHDCIQLAEGLRDDPTYSEDCGHFEPTGATA